MNCPKLFSQPEQGDLRLLLKKEEERNARLKRMVLLLAVLFGYSLGVLLGTLVILYITKI